MKVLKQESEAVQKAAQEAIALLKQAYEKLSEVYANQGVMKDTTIEGCECVIHALVAIVSAAGWLNKEPGDEEGMLIPTLDIPLTEAIFEF